MIIIKVEDIFVNNFSNMLRGKQQLFFLKNQRRIRKLSRFNCRRSILLIYSNTCTPVELFGYLFNHKTASFPYLLRLETAEERNENGRHVDINSVGRW